MTRARRAGWWGWLLAAALAWIVAYPLFLVLIEGLRGAGGWTLDEVRRFASRPSEWQALWASLWLSAASVVLAGLIGVPLAFLFERVDFPGRRLLGALVALPAVLPPLVGVVAFLFLYGETGFAGRLVQSLLRLEDPPWRLAGPGAILLVHAYSMYVYFYLFGRAALSRLDGAMLEAASALGAGRWRTLRYVVLPHLRPALVGAALLTFMTSLASFSAPYIFGGGYRVMTTQIVFTRLNGDDRLAMVETTALMALALGAMALFRRADPGGSLASVGKGNAPSLARSGSAGARAGIAVAAWLLALVLLLPHLTLLLVSFVPVGTWTTETWPPAFSPGNYAALFSEPERLRPLLNSLWMATAATLTAVGVALAAGWLVVRSRVQAGRLIEGLLGLPWAVPGTVFAIALAALFSVHSPLTLRAVLVGTVWILPLAYLVRNLPITGRAILAGFRQLDPSLEEAAAALGASRARTFRRVVLPGLAPALAAGATLAFVTALGDFITSIMLYTYNTRPISMEILGSLRQGDVGVAAAYGVLLMLASAAVFALGARGEARA
ncbi:MAG TPA: iron ABC transporter permease [Gemmatimonadales bacterium]|nr:iron ABC transporter permease [Gemmatimonadales bacterium]